MTLEDLWEVARKALPEGAAWGVSQGINDSGGGWASVQVHADDPRRWIERSIHRSVYQRGGSQSALELLALAIVEGKWTVNPPPAPGPAPVSPQEAA